MGLDFPIDPETLRETVADPDGIVRSVRERDGRGAVRRDVEREQQLVSVDRPAAGG